jgi:hypothetical protein
LKEFLDLEQGNHSVFDYIGQFNTLAQYGSYHIDMDEKKANMYRAGLLIHLQECLVQFTCLSYNELASAAIDQERMMKAATEADEKKRKRMMPGSAGSGSSSSAPPKYRRCIPHFGVSCANRNNSRTRAIAHNSNRGNSSSNSRNSSSTMLLLRCCSRLPSGLHNSFSPATFHASTMRRWGHFAQECRQPKQNNSLQALAPVVNQQRGQQKGPGPWTGHANYTTMDEISTGEEVLTGSFFLNKHLVIILFDSRASHDFMSSTYVKKAKLSLVALGAPYVISSFRGRVDADRIVQKVPLELSERIFSTT